MHYLQQFYVLSCRFVQNSRLWRTQVRCRVKMESLQSTNIYSDKGHFHNSGHTTFTVREYTVNYNAFENSTRRTQKRDWDSNSLPVGNILSLLYKRETKQNSYPSVSKRNKNLGIWSWSVVHNRRSTQRHDSEMRKRKEKKKKKKEHT